MSPNFWGPRCCGEPGPDGYCHIRWYPLNGSAPDPLAAWYQYISGGADGLHPMLISGDEWLWTVSQSGIVQMHYPAEGDGWGEIFKLDPYKPEYSPPAGAVGTSKGPKNINVRLIQKTDGTVNDIAYATSNPVIQLETDQISGSMRDLTFPSSNFDAHSLHYLYNGTPDSFSINAIGGGGAAAGSWNPWSPSSPDGGFSPWGGYNMTGAGESADYPAPQFAIDGVVGKLDIEFSPTNWGESTPTDFYEIPTSGFWKMYLTQWVGDVPCGGKGAYSQGLGGSGNSEWTAAVEAAENDTIYASVSGIDQVSDWLVLVASFNSCFDNIASVTGVEVTIRRYAENDSPPVNIKDSQLIPQIASTAFDSGGWVDGIDQAATSVKWSAGIEDAVYGGPGNLMGLNDTPDTTFQYLRFKYQVRHSSAGCDAFVDGFNVTLYYIDSDGNAGSTDIDHSHYVAPGQVGFYVGRMAAVGEFGDSTGYKTTFLPDQLPLSITGSELASILKDKEYLDPRYDVTGTGSLLTPGEKITLTFTYVDGPTRDVTYTLNEGNSDPDNLVFGFWKGVVLVGVGGLAYYADEVATLHKLQGVNPSIGWSRGDGTEDIVARYLQTPVTAKASISPTGDGDIITRYGAKVRGNTDGVFPGNYNYIWTVRQYHTDGTPVDEVGTWINFEYNHVGSRYYSSFSPRWVDGAGNLYTSKNVYEDPVAMRKFGPTPDPNAFRHLIWGSLEDTFSCITETTESYLLIGGRGYVAKINKQSGSTVWRTELPHASNGIDPQPVAWISHYTSAVGPSAAIFVAANFGVYELLASTGEVVGYFPHGNRTTSCIYRFVNGIHFLVLTGARALIDIDEQLLDMTPF